MFFIPVFHAKLMDEGFFKKLCIACSIIGFISLVFLSNYSVPSKKSLNELNDKSAGLFVEVEGIVEKPSESKKTLFFMLSNDNESLRAVLFNPKKEERALVFEGNKLSVQGKIQEFKGNLEIIVEKITDGHD